MVAAVLLLQLVVFAAGFALLWRRIEALHADVRQLRADLPALEARAAPRAQSSVAGAAAAIVSPKARAAEKWRRPAVPKPPTPARTHPAVQILKTHGFILFAALLPLFVLLQPNLILQSAAWAASGIAGLYYAANRTVVHGAAVAALAATALGVMSANLGVVSHAGAGLGVLITFSAVLGAFRPRLESLHTGAFIAALACLYVLSGQRDAAIWYTPVATWTGALFLAVAAVRVPQIGARGLLVAATGVIAPWAVIASLFAAHHGLADRFAASGAFAALAAIFAGVLFLAYRRRGRDLEALGPVLWALAAGAFMAIAASIILAAPAAAAASPFALLALGMAWLHTRARHSAWIAFAALAVALATLFAALAVRAFLSESATLAPWLVILAGVAAPAALFAGSAYAARQANRPALTTGFFLSALAFATCALNLAVRLVFAGEALRLAPVTFLEASVHISLWLIAAIVAAAGVNRGPRLAAAMTLSVCALAANALTALYWLTPVWANRAGGDALDQPLGFIPISFLFAAHWVFWRARDSDLRTRIAFAAAAANLAFALTLWTVLNVNMPEWSSALLGSLALGGAILVNMTSGITQSHRRI